LESVRHGLQFGAVALLEHAGGGDGLGALAGVDGLLRVPPGLHPALADADPVRAEPEAGDQQHDGAADREPGAQGHAAQEAERDADHGFVSGVMTVPSGVAVAVADVPGGITIASGWPSATPAVWAVFASVSIVSACFFCVLLLPK
jgi:hypothetical protein